MKVNFFMSNYLYYEYTRSMVCKVKEDHKEYEKYPTIQRYLNIQCLENGSTMRGRQDAFQFLMKQKKFTPVLISIHPVLIYFPTEAKDNPNCVWINYMEIEHVKYEKKKCTIYFKDHTQFISYHPKRIQNSMILIKRYLLMLNR